MVNLAPPQDAPRPGQGLAEPWLFALGAIDD